MLVLSRKKFESVLIGDNITLTVVELDRGKVRLGISAPPEVKIYRKEVAEARRKAAEENGDESA